MSRAIATFCTEACGGSSPGQQLGAEIARLCSHIYAAEARLLKLIRVFDNGKYWAEAGFCSCAHWLNFKCGIGMNAARERLRVAHALDGLPIISAAFENGELSYSKVRAMTRIANDANEAYLLTIAHHGTAHHVERLVAKFRTAKRLQDAELANTNYEDREVTHYYDHDGSLVIKARLPAEQGALVVKALEMAMDKSIGSSDARPESKGEDEPVAARRADAFAEIAETYMNNSKLSGSTADRYQVVVHLTARHSTPGPTLQPQGVTALRESDNAHIENGPHVTAETSRRIACDCSVVAITEGEFGEPLSIGRRLRSIPSLIRRALRARDDGCRFPGCTNTRFVDGHHIQHWADGGETSIGNLVSLCRHHHRLVHEGGFVCEKSSDGEVLFKDQRAVPLLESSPLPGLASRQPIQAWLDREFFEADIDSETCTAKWYAGDNMDWQMAVSALF